MLTKKFSLILIFSIILTLGLSISLSSVLAVWTAPISAPPEGNIPAFLNTSATGQAKQGGLIINTGGSTNGLIVQYGNIGIGTAAPEGKLTISGSNYLIENNGTFSGNTINSGIYSDGAGQTKKPIGINIESSATTDNIFSNFATNWANAFIISAGGVESADYNLHPYLISKNSYYTSTDSAEVRGSDKYSQGAGIKLQDKTSYLSGPAYIQFSGYSNPSTAGDSVTETPWVTFKTGLVGIGTTDPKTKLDVAGPVKVGSYTTAARPACDANLLGSFIFDTTEGKPYVCNGSIWKPLDSDYDKDGIVDWNDWDDTDPSKKDPNLIAENIKSGVTIFDVTGTGCPAINCYSGGNPQTTGWDAGLYGCVGSNKRCYYGSCVTCGGIMNSGYCWYKGVTSQTCGDACNAHGGVYNNSCNWVGLPFTCALNEQFGYCGGCAADGRAYGPAIYSSNSFCVKHLAGSDDCANVAPGYARFCACNQ